MNLGLAAYNTFAQVHNTMARSTASVRRSRPSASCRFGRRGTRRRQGQGGDPGAMIAIAVVVLALSAGVILTAVLIHRYAGTVPVPAAAATAPRTA